jgi:aerobic-type carbon monoxide dehydrogenase small subunit (CoxS/CutS family)
MNFTVNGVVHEVSGSELTPLLDVLRDTLGVTGAKAGCHQGGCGSCTVLVDGEPRRSCLLPVGYADGTQITTVEGLGGPENLSPVQQAFVHHSTGAAPTTTRRSRRRSAATSAAAPGTRRSSMRSPQRPAATPST